MARTASIVALALAICCIGMMVQETAGAEPEWAKHGKKTSHWGGHYYWPIKNDRSWTYYRMNLKLKITFSDTGDVTPGTTGLFMGSSFGDVFDLNTNAKLGFFQGFTVSTGTEATMPGGEITVGTMSNLVIELGSDGNDSITISGATATTVPSGTQPVPNISDADNAVTGGIGRYLGAGGQFIYKSYEGTEITGVLEVWVPKLSNNW